MTCPRTERFYVPEAEVDEVVKAISGYRGWVIRYLHSLGYFIAVSEEADDKLRVFLRVRLSG